VSKVVSLDSHRTSPHLCGLAVCLSCKHEWSAVAPVGTVVVICPKCDCDGALKGFIRHDGDSWVCTCGCDLFRYDRKGAYCIKCGVEPIFGAKP